MLANESADKRKEAMKEKITKKIPKLEKKVEQFKTTIMDEKFLNINSNIYEILNEIERIEIECEQLVS